jgi:serine/threonine protein kinase
VRTDIYAFGCVAYYLLTGQLVFDGKTPMNLFLQHLQSTPTRLSERTELHVPRDLERLVMACLEKDPARRPQSARELLQRLSEVSLDRPWTSDNARAWWELHLAELTGPLDAESAAEPAATVKVRRRASSDTSRTTRQVRFA